MVALMAGIAIAMILSTVAVQSFTDVSRRDKEAEMIFRAQDITRALKRFQLEKGKLPTELKELMEPGNKSQYFLRRLWKDPLVKGGQWQYLYASPTGGLLDPTAAAVPGAPPASGLPPSGQTQTPSTGTQPGAFPPIGKPGEGAADVTGLPIAGVKSRCTDRPFRRYKDKTNYGEWTFSIFDLDQQAPATAVNPQNPTGASFPPTGGTPTPTTNPSNR